MPLRGTDDRLQSAYAPASAAASRLRAELPAETPVVVRSAAGSTGFDFRFDFAAAIAYDLRRDGRRVYTPGLALGAEYAEPPPADAPVIEVGGETVAHAGATRVASARVTAGDDRPAGGGPPRPRTVTVDLLQTGR